MSITSGLPAEPERAGAISAAEAEDPELGDAVPGDGGRARRQMFTRQASNPDFIPARRGRVRHALEWAAIIATALIVAVLVKTFVIQAFYIPSGSMEPTLNVGDRILVLKVSYDMHSIHRGDIIVFTNPEKSNTSVRDLVKRVIGLPGDVMSSNAAGQVMVDGKVLPESYLPKGTPPGPAIRPAVTVPSGDVFVMGDNRSNSQDSRYFGPVPANTVIGRVVMRIWPLDHIAFY